MEAFFHALMQDILKRYLDYKTFGYRLCTRLEHLY